MEFNNCLVALCVTFSAVSFLETGALQEVKLSIPCPNFVIIV